MAFIAKTDLALSILSDELTEITRNDDTLIAMAIDAAQAEMRTYLFDSYDVDTIFAKTGSNRHQLLVQLLADMAIYFLVARLQAGQDISDREARYKRAVAWLKQAQSSETYSDLPRRISTAQTIFTVGSNTKRPNYY
jgi:phage gp36-like protein